MNLDRILELLAKQIGNAASADELLELEHLLRQHPQHRHLVSILKSIQSKKLKQPAQNEDLLVREGWQKLQAQMNAVGIQKDERQEQKIKKITPRYLLWAAIFTGCIAIGAVLWFSTRDATNLPPFTASMQEAIPAGKPEKRILPDGSEVWINAGSTILYSNSDSGTRDVYLEGEAYFKVKHDAEHPFIVHAGNIAVRALGTEFNVLAYPGDDHVEATLITGRVQVTMEEKPDQKIILIPNEKLTISNRAISQKDSVEQRETSFEVKPVQILPTLREAKEIVWMQDKLAFQNESFYNLAKRMERRYNVHIVFFDELLKKETLTGVFENENIQKALRVLKMTTAFEYRIKSDSVFLSRP